MYEFAFTSSSCCSSLLTNNWCSYCSSNFTSFFLTTQLAKVIKPRLLGRTTMQKIVVFVSVAFSSYEFSIFPYAFYAHVHSFTISKLGITDQCSQEQTAWISAGAMGVHRASHVLCGWHKVLHPTHSISPLSPLYFHGYQHLLLCLDSYGVAYIKTWNFSQASRRKGSHERRQGVTKCLLYYMSIQIQIKINENTFYNNRLGCNGSVRVASPWHMQRKPRDS